MLFFNSKKIAPYLGSPIGALGVRSTVVENLRGRTLCQSLFECVSFRDSEIIKRGYENITSSPSDVTLSCQHMTNKPSKLGRFFCDQCLSGALCTQD